ncbi:zinc-ribbon domain-containing protein [Desulfobacula phenolica]|uniref:Probable Zinc-ribbon domain-containing protein n=1 Tax=Desulfobacula phenolica TaxID=90732 RepID=A0A1H2EC53_9BACT|nr:zinc-ribbon domain-containing protein [Desulfobacula phenolica]SDT92702.1 Probable Zinc-ribbon domain-containing protein [Desulfobacula phenolica]
MKKLFKDNQPDLYKEVHPDKNEDLDFSTLFENSGKKIWWQCLKDKRHIWQQSITNRVRKGYGCPYCGRRKTLPEESFGALYPEIAAEIHPEKSKDFDPFKYRPGSNKKIWWKCKYGHEWRQIVSQRVTRGRLCQICKRKKISFGAKYPEIAVEWHPTKNGNLLPEDILTGDRRSIWWQCKKNPDHEWEVSVESRARSNYGCPHCNKEKKKKEYPLLQEYAPELIPQWHPEKNKPLNLSDFKANSAVKIWWICPINKSHEWETSIRNRTLRNQGCPFCSKNRVTTKNSLIINYPEIAEQWHPKKNKNLSPEDVSYASHKKVWWQCTKNKSHEWQQTITSRTQRNVYRCPLCKEVKNNLQKIHPEIAAEWHPTKNGTLKPDQVSRASGKKVWWKCSVNPDHEWEAVVLNRTSGKSGCFHCFKEKTSIRLSEGLMDLRHDDIDCYHIFLSNMRSVKKLLSSEIKGDSRLMQPFYRMLYASIITLLEAFLSDAFHNAIMNDLELFEKFITKNPAFNEKKYKLSIILDWSKHINKRVSEYLYNEVLWHNMERIEPLYKDVLGIDFPKNIVEIKKAVSIRYDIVHRNGRKKSGGYHKFSEDRLEKLSENVKGVVTEIHEQLTDL